MISLLINLVILLIALGLVYWITTLFPLPPPFPKIIQVVFAVIGVLILLDLLLGVLGGGIFFRTGPMLR